LGRFAIMDADRVVSLRHVAAAGSIALSRWARWRRGAQKKSERGADDNDDRRGIGQETVICAAGTSHAGYALRDYGFLDVAPATETEKTQKQQQQQQQQQQQAKTTPSSFTILALGFDCENDAEYCRYLADLGLGEGRPDMDQYFGRQRSELELAALLKAFKISQNEVDMDGSSLEHAVITRIATKFVV